MRWFSPFFCDGVDRRCFIVFLQHGPTMGKYLQHLGWVHRVLGLSNGWWYDSMSHVVKGACRRNPVALNRRFAIRSDVRRMIIFADIARDYYKELFKNKI